MNPAIGVIEKKNRRTAAIPRTVVESSAFAAGIAERYAAGAAGISGAKRALAYEHPRPNVFHGSTRIEVSPVVNFHKHFAQIQHAGKAEAAREQTEDFGQAQAEALFGRLFSRATRAVSFEPGSSSSTRQPDEIMAPILRGLSSAGKPESIERVLPQPFVSKEISDSAARPKAPVVINSEKGWGTPVAAPLSAPVNLPAPEIRRVADQVMRELDHRMLARRERLGRR